VPPEPFQFHLLRCAYGVAILLFILTVVFRRTRWGLAWYLRPQEEEGTQIGKRRRWMDAVLLAGLVLMAGFPYLGSYQAAPLPAAAAAEPVITVPHIAAASMLQLMAAVCLVLYLRLVRGVNPASALGLGRLSLGKVLAGGFVTLLVVVVTAQAVNWAFYQWLVGMPPPEDTDQQLVQLFKTADQGSLRIAIVLMCVVVAPLTEELLYRGFVFGIARDWAGSWPAAAFSAAVFSLAHQNLMAALPLFVLGLGFALSYQRSRCLWVPMLAHALFNAGNLAALAWGS